MWYSSVNSEDGKVLCCQDETTIHCIVFHLNHVTDGKSKGQMMKDSTTEDQDGSQQSNKLKRNITSEELGTSL